MNELALFAGAGGGILGSELLGFRTVCAVELEPYPASVLLARQNDGLLRTTPYPQTWREYPEIVRECAAELRSRNIEINNMDALQVMARYDSTDTLHYVDPPYVQSTRGNHVRYEHEYDQQDHERLLFFLQSLKGKIVLSGYDSDLYSRNLSGWRKECKVSHDTQGGKKIECLWMNYNPQLTLF